jgi:hypothetical protein
VSDPNTIFSVLKKDRSRDTLARQREAIMRERFSGSIVAVAVAGAVIPVLISGASAQAPAASGTGSDPVLKTPWGEPDLQGIWTDETTTPLERPATYATQEFFTEAQRVELDNARATLPGKDRRAERGTEIDVTGSYNQVFLSRKRTGARTSLIVDPFVTVFANL